MTFSSASTFPSSVRFKPLTANGRPRLRTLVPPPSLFSISARKLFSQVLVLGMGFSPVLVTKKRLPESHILSPCTRCSYLRELLLKEVSSLQRRRHLSSLGLCHTPGLRWFGVATAGSTQEGVPARAGRPGCVPCQELRCLHRRRKSHWSKMVTVPDSGSSSVKVSTTEKTQKVL